MSVSDDYRDSFTIAHGFTAANTGTIADMQRKYLINIWGYAGPAASIRDMYQAVNPNPAIHKFKTLFNLF